MLAVVLVGLYAAPWRGSPLESLERPAEALERLVSRDLDARDALRASPRWEQLALRRARGRRRSGAGGASSGTRSCWRWWTSAPAELYYAVLKAEAGELPARGADREGWVSAAYAPDPLDPERGPRDDRAHPGHACPANWFTDTLVARIARKIGDASTAARAEADIVARGRSLLARWRTLTAAEGALILSALVLLVIALRRGGFPRVGSAPLPPPWGFGDGYALVVRGVLGLLGLTLVVIVIVPDARTVIRFASFLAGLPVLLWTAGYLRSRGESFARTFGLAPPPGLRRAASRPRARSSSASAAPRRRASAPR